MEALKKRLFSPIDASVIVFFRVGFGAIAMWEVWRYLEGGIVSRHWIDPEFHFTYYGFGWVAPLPGNLLLFLWVGLGLLGGLIMVGLWYRAATILFFLGFTYIFLLEQARYLNHLYLVCLIAFLMIFIPANRAFSIDARWKPGIKSKTVPAWCLWLLRAQIGIPYFYGGLAKLNTDWLAGNPMHMWLQERNHYPLVGPWFEYKSVALFFAYSGLILDLAVVPLLLWRRTRIAAYLFVLVFHLMNAVLFSIGIFPWFMIVASLIFFDPDWPRRIGRKALNAMNYYRRGVEETDRIPLPSAGWQTATVVFLGLYMAVQLALPFRHFLYPGNVSWTEEGHNLSWHMKLRDKRARARFFVKDVETQREWQIDLRDYLNRRQARKMVTRPDLIAQFAQYIERKMREEGHKRVEVHARVYASLNGREPQLLVDPTVDLARVERSLAPKSWIVPLNNSTAGSRRESAEAGDPDGGDE